MGDSYDVLKAFIAEGIPEDLPDHPGYDDSVDHAPPRRQILNSDEKKLALRNALRYFYKNIIQFSLRNSLMNCQHLVE